MSKAVATFSPDRISPPGDTILDLLEEHGWKQTELAKRTGYTTKHISLLINGKAPITEDTAIKLERVVGSPLQLPFIENCNELQPVAIYAAVKLVVIS